MVEGTEFPSLMDDAEFLIELEKLEGEPPRPSADRASRVALATGFTAARQPVPSPSTRPLVAPLPTNTGDVGIDMDEVGLDLDDVAEPMVARDANRWNILNPAAEELETIATGPVSVVPVFLTILIGMSAGVAGSALLFHDRLSQIISLWSR